MSATYKTETTGKMATIDPLIVLPSNFLSWKRNIRLLAAAEDMHDNCVVFDGHGEYNIQPRTEDELEALLGYPATQAVISKFAADMRLIDIKEVLAVRKKNAAFIALMIKHTSVDSLTTLKGKTGWEDAVKRSNLQAVYALYDGLHDTTAMETREDRMTKAVCGVQFITERSGLTNWMQEPLSK